jgi:hypothetical protein
VLDKDLPSVVSRLRTLVEVLRVTRVATAYGVVANMLFVVLWVRRHPEHEPAGLIATLPLALALLSAAAVGIGLYAYATAVNDVFDANRDRALRLDRPIATGGLSIEATLGVVLATAGLAIGGSVFFGSLSVLIAMTLLFAAFVYNASIRFVPGIGLPMLGLLYAGPMLVPTPGLIFLWPVWVVLTHVTLTAMLTHAVGKRSPRLTVRSAITAVILWLLISIGGGLWAWWRSPLQGPIWPDWAPLEAAIWPVAMMLGYLVLALWVVYRRGRGTRSAERLWRYGALWMPLYCAAFFFGDQAYWNAAAMLGIAAAGPIAIAVVREIYGLVQHPVGFRLN